VTAGVRSVFGLFHVVSQPQSSPSSSQCQSHSSLYTLHSALRSGPRRVSLMTELTKLTVTAESQLRPCEGRSARSSLAGSTGEKEHAVCRDGRDPSVSTPQCSERPRERLPPDSGLAENRGGRRASPFTRHRVRSGGRERPTPLTTVESSQSLRNS
jgi:hypothetical protein